jgi:transposase
LKLRGEHVMIRKEKGRPRGRHHINGIEGFWSYAKNWLYAFRGVPREYFHLYLGEVCFRFNHRHEDLFARLYKLLRHTPVDDVRPITIEKRAETNPARPTWQH